MKKYLLGLAVLLMGTAVMTSCSDDNDGPETYLQEYSTGAYVVNSGNMYNKIESSLTAIDYASSTATQKVFKAANGRSLGNTANDGIVYGNKIYLAVDQSNTIEVIDKKPSRVSSKSRLQTCWTKPRVLSLAISSLTVARFISPHTVAM